MNFPVKTGNEQVPAKIHLRVIDLDRFIDVTMQDKVESILQNADVESGRILHETDFTGLFGVL